MNKYSPTQGEASTGAAMILQSLHIRLSLLLSGLILGSLIVHNRKKNLFPKQVFHMKKITAHLREGKKYKQKICLFLPAALK